MKHGPHFICNLVTKAQCWEKPTYEALGKCLRALHDFCNTLQVKWLAIPQLGCGLDGVDWNKVHRMISEVFHNIAIDINIYQLTELVKLSSSERPGPCLPMPPLQQPIIHENKWPNFKSPTIAEDERPSTILQSRVEKVCTMTGNRQPSTNLQSRMEEMYNTLENKQLEELRQSQAANTTNPSRAPVMCAIYRMSEVTANHTRTFHFSAIPLCVGVKRTHARNR